MKEKVLITGANGSLAKSVKDNLLSKGYEVVTLTSTKTSADNKSIFYIASEECWKHTKKEHSP